jgi:hypothetical protein
MLGLALAIGAQACAQAAVCPAGAPPRRVVLTIGINHYHYNDKWPTLRTAVNDADSLEQVLETKFGYQSYESLAKLPNGSRLRDEKATRDAINDLVVDNISQVLCPNDDFILFFSGHGTSRPYQNGSIKGTSGYLVPYDGKDQGVSSLIEIKEFLENLGRLPARHILVILDACHSGIAIQDALQGLKSSGDYQAALAARPSRKVIVSAQPEQTASDSGSVPNHSLFGGVLFQALDQGLASNGKGFIVDSELAEFVKQGVANQNRDQLPDSVPFYGNEGGSLVLNLGEDLAGIYRNAMQNLVEGNTDDFRLNVRKAATRSPDDPVTWSLQYRLALMQGRIDDASEAIEKLRSYAVRTNANSDSLPLSRSSLTSIRHQLSFWKSALQIPVTTLPPAVVVHLYTGETEQNLIQLSGSSEFSIDPEANLYFKLRARSDAIYVYVFRIDKLGQIESVTDFIRQRENPVDADGERLAAAQNGPEPDDIQEWHFIFSRSEIDALSTPPNASDLAGATHYVITVRPGG